MQLCGHCIIQAGWIEEKRGRGEKGEWEQLGTGRKDEMRGGEIGLGMGQRME